MTIAIAPTTGTTDWLTTAKTLSDQFATRAATHDAEDSFVAENYAAMKAKGDYRNAGISLVEWQTVAPERQRVLWKTVLNGRVSNAIDFAPKWPATGA